MNGPSSSSVPCDRIRLMPQVTTSAPKLAAVEPAHDQPLQDDAEQRHDEERQRSPQAETARPRWTMMVAV